MKNIKLKINFDFGKYKKDRVIRTTTDDNGIILDRYWRQRLKDSEIDGCISVVKEKREVKSNKAQTGNVHD